MARIPPANESSAPLASRELAAAHAASGGRMTNMKWTLAHSPVALDALLQWYPLRDAVLPLLGERTLWIFCHAISTQSECVICSTFFRRLLVQSGEDPDRLALDEWESAVVAFGRSLAVTPHVVPDPVYQPIAERLSREQIVVLTTFGALMVATNVFNNAVRVPLDEYLEPFRQAEERHG